MASSSPESASIPMIPSKARKDSFLQTLKKPDPSPLSTKTPEKSDLGIRDLESEVGKRSSCIGDRNLVDFLEKYEMLCKFFNAMVSSIQLLRLKRSSPTFANVSRMVESMTDRRFTRNHLAQMKYILPEAILTKKIRVKDEETSCMKDELHITLDAEVLQTKEDEKGVRGPSLLKKVFTSRILEFCKTHPEEDHIPEGTLPVLLHLQSNADDITISQSNRVSTASHVPLSFRKQFTHKKLSSMEDNKIDTQQIPTSCVQESNIDVLESEASYEGEQNSVLYPATQFSPLSMLATPRKESNSQLLLSSMLAMPRKETDTKLPPSSMFVTPRKESGLTEDSQCSKGAASTCKTPVEVVSTPKRLMASPPALKPPKRPYMSPHNDSLASPQKLVRRSGRKSLKFGPPEEDDSLAEGQVDQVQGTVSDDELSFLPRSILQSVREEEQKILEEKDPAISQAKKLHRMMARLPQLFDTIHLLFQSINHSVITKEEFMYKIIMGNWEIIDRSEVEEQLKLLQELVPDYISEQSCLSGDTLIRLNKFSSSRSIRVKLIGAEQS